MKVQQKTLEKIRLLINEETEYRSGPKLVQFFNKYGFNDIYGQGFPSRWIYTDNCLSKLNKDGRIDEVIKDLLSPVNFIEGYDLLKKCLDELNKYLLFDGYKVSVIGKTIAINKTDEKIIELDAKNRNEEDDLREFMKTDFNEVDITLINIDAQVTKILKERLNELKICLKYKANLAVIFLCGSILEGVFLGVATKYPARFNCASCSPKSAKDGKVKFFNEWKLVNFIDVSREIDLVGEEVKKYSHSLREFRNYIHPYQQMLEKYSPNDDSAKISWQVLKATISQIIKNQSKL